MDGVTFQRVKTTPGFGAMWPNVYPSVESNGGPSGIYPFNWGEFLLGFTGGEIYSIRLG